MDNNSQPKTFKCPISSQIDPVTCAPFNQYNLSNNNKAIAFGASSPGACDVFEEDHMSQAMPLLPSGELPPTWNSSNTDKKATKHTRIASGISAQYISHHQYCADRDAKQVRCSPARTSEIPISAPIKISDSASINIASAPINIKGSASAVIDSDKDDDNDDRDFTYYSELMIEDDPLSPAMPLLSLEESLKSPSKAAAASTAPKLPPPPRPAAKIYQRNLSLPLLNNNVNGSTTNNPTAIVSDLRKFPSSISLQDDRSNPCNMPMPLPKEPPKKNNSLKKHLSAISHKMRTRLMLDDDSRLSSSLPDKCFPFDIYFDYDPFPSSSEPQRHQNQSFDIDVDQSNKLDGSESLDSLAPQDADESLTGSDYCDIINVTNLKNNNSNKINSDNANKRETVPIQFSEGSHNSAKTSEILAAHSGTKDVSVPCTNAVCFPSPFVAGSSPSSSFTPQVPSFPPPFSANPLTPLSSSTAATGGINGGVTAGILHTATASNEPEDRYAALKDLDEEFKIHKEVPPAQPAAASK